MKLAYIRVSTIEQNEERQLETLQRYGIEKIFSEKVSAKDTNRPKLKELLEFAREGDTVFIESFSRLARNTKDLLYLVETFTAKGVYLVSSKEQIDTSTPTGRLLLTVIGAIGQFERECLLERQRESINLAKKKGLYKGRKPICIDNFEFHYKRWKTRQVTKVQLAKELNISRQTLYKLIKEYSFSSSN